MLGFCWHRKVEVYLHTAEGKVTLRFNRFRGAEAIEILVDAPKSIRITRSDWIDPEVKTYRDPAHVPAAIPHARPLARRIAIMPSRRAK